MKKLSIEEKARAYDEALKVTKNLIGAGLVYEDAAIQISPELAESEDERVRKKLLLFFTERANYTEDSTFNGLSSKEIIAWIEKQGKHAKFIDSIQVGDHVTRNQDGVLVNLSQLKRVAKKDEKQGEPIDKIVEKARTEKQRVLLTETDGSANIDWDCRSLDDVKLLLEYGLDYIKKLEKQGEQKPADKVEPKFHEGDWITNGDYTWKIVEIKPLDYILQSQDGNVVDDTISHVDEHFHSFTPQKEWGEDDRIRIANCIQLIGKTGDGEVEWLKSLESRIPPQPKQGWNEDTLKPSDDEMEALANALSLAKSCGEESCYDLRTLYEKLKKLKEG